MFDSTTLGSEEIQFDKDIDRDKIDCDIMRHLLDRYSSFICGESDYDSAIYLYDRKGFITFDYQAQPLYPKITSREEYRQFETEDIVPFASMLRCVYTPKCFRGRGWQSGIFNEIKELSEQTGKPFTAWASPFRLKDSAFEKSGKDAMIKMIKQGYRKPKGFNLAKEKQRARFERYGLQNFWNPHSESNSPDWYIYMPDSAPADHKKTIKTLLRDKDS